MFGLETLDVLIGLVTVYLAFGVACTAFVEALAAWFKVRSKKLEAAMDEFLAGDVENKKFVTAFYGHPLVQSLSKGKKGRPSYIPAATVSQVIEDLVMAGKIGKSLEEAVNALPDPADKSQTNRIKGLLEALVKQAGGDAARFKRLVEAHFDTVMDRASGWVKRRQQMTAVIISIFLVGLANVDTIAIATSLASNQEARAAVVGIAQEQLDRAKTGYEQVKAGKGGEEFTVGEARKKYDTAVENFDQAKLLLQSAGIPIGWKGQWRVLWTRDQFPAGILSKLAGLLVSIFAISLGAPFWFDVLQRIMKVRATGFSEQKGGRRR
jgi:hypothetical protein